jgi:hypothetical protein
MDDLFSPPAIVRQSDEELAMIAVNATNLGDAKGWEAADAYAELHKRGWTQQKIADRCSVSQTYVSLCITCTKTYSRVIKRPRFADAFRQCKEVKQPTAVTSLCPACQRRQRVGQGITPNCPDCRALRNGQQDPKPPESPQTSANTTDNNAVAIGTENTPDDEPGTPAGNRIVTQPPPEPTLADRIDKVTAKLEELADKAFTTRGSYQEATASRQRLERAIEDVKNHVKYPVRPPAKVNCKTCQTPILLVVTENDTWVPLGREPVIGGRFEVMKNVAVHVDFDKETPRFRRHECPLEEKP